MSIFRCTIDTSTREITIPEEAALLGVTSDEKANTLYFEMEDIFDSYSSLTFKMNYQNAGGYKGAYSVNDLNKTAGKLYFDVLLGREITRYAGEVQISISATKTNSSDVVIYEWGSLVANATVIEGLKYDPIYDPADEDDSITFNDIKNNLQAQITTLSTALSTLTNQVTSSLDSIDDDIDGLDTRVTALEDNSSEDTTSTTDDSE